MRTSAMDGKGVWWCRWFFLEKFKDLFYPFHHSGFCCFKYFYQMLL